MVQKPKKDSDVPGAIMQGIGVVICGAFVVVGLNLFSGGAIFDLVGDVVSADSAAGSSTSDASPTTTPTRPAPIAADPPSKEPTDDQIAEALGGTWDCTYDPSMNHDWHDDVICRNGVDFYRPILLPNSDFVTAAEMQAAGDAYEAELNGSKLEEPNWMKDPKSGAPTWSQPGTP